MKILLAAINAKYTHTNLAVRYLRNALLAAGMEAEFREYTINQPVMEILTDLVSCQPDRLLFSCYLWNIQYVQRLGADFRKLFPKAVLLVGGPEVSFDPQWQLERLPWADGVLCGEGEPLVAQVLAEEHPSGIYGFQPHKTGFVDMDTLPFPYEDLGALKDRVLYYESSRGCPYGCAYCLSSADRTTRFRSLELVYQDLGRFLEAGVMQVKFVDRTFNLNPERALSIWKYLGEHDNGHTSFQMELGGDLFTQEQLDYLGTLRPGLLQFEIGVQSTCAATLEQVARPTRLDRLEAGVRAIKSFGNIHQHLDLIAGLPLEDFQRFAQSYDQVYALEPEQLQLGFLKLLRGSKLWEQRERYGLIHSDDPPYQILATPQLSFFDLARLKGVEEMTEVYYNSGRFSHTLSYLMSLCPSPFQAMLELSQFLPQGKIGKYAYYDQLYGFLLKKGGDPELGRWLVWYDLCLHERPKKLPECCGENPLRQKYRQAIASFRPPKTAHLELFPIDVTKKDFPKVMTPLLFDYQRRDFHGHAQVTQVTLEL